MRALKRGSLWLLAVMLALMPVLAGCAAVPQPLRVVVDSAGPGPGAYAVPAVGDTHFTNVIASGVVEAGTFLILDKASSTTVTNGSTLTPVASYMPIAAAAGSSITLSVTSMTTGTLLRLVNTGSYVITVTESTTAKTPSTGIALGQYDSAMLLFDGTYWIAMGTSDN